MKTGNIIQPDKHNPHLDEPYIELYPQGNVRDLAITTAIPKLHKSYSRRDVLTGPTPLLVRLSYWKEKFGEVAQ